MTGPIERAIARMESRSATQQHPTATISLSSMPTPPDTPIHTPSSSVSAADTARRRVHVNMLRDRYTVTIWMKKQAELHGETHIISKAVKQLALNLNGLWEESQLTNQLQQIIAKHRNHLNGEPVDNADVDTESESE